VNSTVSIIWPALLSVTLLFGAAGWYFRHPIQSELQRITLPEIAPAPKGVIRFAVIGDYGSGDHVAKQVAQMVESWKPAFITTVGDNNYPTGQAETIDQNIGRFFHAYISPYKGNYGTGATTNRFFPIIGHRDWDSPQGLQPYLDYFELPGNERYYEFAQGPVHFFMLDTDQREPDGASANSIQGRWLERKLAESKAAWKLVFAHHAPYSSGRVPDFEHMRWPFKAWGADAVLSGYYHVYERLSVEDIPYFVNGMGGAFISGFGETDARSRFRYDADNGAMLVDAIETRMTFRFVNRDGRIVDEYALERDATGPRSAPARSRILQIMTRSIQEASL
jgi:tartrate-resistant acid phosphatase type 5